MWNAVNVIWIIYAKSRVSEQTVLKYDVTANFTTRRNFLSHKRTSSLETRNIHINY